MGRTSTDIDVIKAEVKCLKNLIESANERQQALRGKRPDRSKQKGKVLNHLLETETLINEEWKAYIELVKRTVEFLGDSSAAYEQSDQQGKSQIEKI